jgi:UDP-N-acetylmuramate--alanine ligase
MEPQTPVAPDLPVAELVRTALGRPGTPFTAAPARWLLVDADRQRLLLMHGSEPVEDFAVSTAANGIGGESGSYRTPPGWHKIHRRIGAGQPSGAVFVSREPTGAVWGGEPGPDDLILTRVLTLDGLEPGVNQGPGHDSLERYIYIHGTNHEDELGLRASHGCVRMANADVVRLHDRVEAGDPVVIVGGHDAPAGVSTAAADAPSIPDPSGSGRFHYAGLGGSGMSALAQFQVMSGGRASGSDRAFDRGERATMQAALEKVGIQILPQDGSGLEGSAALVVSTAVEDSVPDVASAKSLGIPVIHRSELLAHYVERRRSIAITGTSGKSTVAAMVFEILRGAGRDPSIITGGDLVVLQNQGLIGNAWAGGSDLLVVEADESDGSLVRYRPAVGVVLNLQKDHKEESEVAKMFETFQGRIREALVVAEDEKVVGLAAAARARGLAVQVFGAGERATLRSEDIDVGHDTSGFDVDGVRFAVPVPGEHNLENALAAVAACRAVGVPLADMVEPLARFHGVSRRFQRVGRARGVEVIDDFAHNPAKIQAALRTAQRRARGRVLAIYQAHGYGPTRFLRNDLIATFVETLRTNDHLWMPEVFYAGGTAVRDFSASQLIDEMAERSVKARFGESREEIVEQVGMEARPGDVVLVMGARDPSLTEFAHALLERLKQKNES